MLLIKKGLYYLIAKMLFKTYGRMQLETELDWKR